MSAPAPGIPGLARPSLRMPSTGGGSLGPPPTSVPDPQRGWLSVLADTPAMARRSVEALGDVVRTTATVLLEDVVNGQVDWRFVARLLGHDLGRVVEPWRWAALGVIPRPLVYYVVLQAIARAVRDHETVPAVPAMEVAARWGREPERVAAAARDYTDRPGRVGTAVLDDGSVTLAAGDAAWLNVLVDNSRPVESDGPMAWGETGRAHAKRLLGYEHTLTDEQRAGLEETDRVNRRRAELDEAAAIGAVPQRFVVGAVPADPDEQPDEQQPGEPTA